MGKWFDADLNASISYHLYQLCGHRSLCLKSSDHSQSSHVLSTTTIATTTRCSMGSSSIKKTKNIDWHVMTPWAQFWCHDDPSVSYRRVGRSRAVTKHTSIWRKHTTEARYDMTIIQHKHTIIIELRRCPEQGRLISKNVPVDNCGLIAAIGGLLFPAAFVSCHRWRLLSSRIGFIHRELRTCH